MDDHILIIDDEASIRFTLERALRREGYALTAVASGREALQKLTETTYDLLLLDLHLGEVNGLQILHAARQRDEDVVVIILTGQGSLETAVEALRLGAFDYLFKPALPDVIRQRVQAGLRKRQRARQRRHILQQIDALRRALQQLDEEENSPTHAMAQENGRFLRSGPLVIDRHHRVVTLYGDLLDLTTTEFDLLACLVEAAPQPVSAQILLQQALKLDGDKFEARETIKWHIHHLRRKIEPDPTQPRFIKTVRYKGYFWSSE
ncbi:MAG: response regulator transcription factor [Anaerolineales bacterium]|nr:response regulator transcription factor [Anaerolineales bacterium]MCB8968485.1 response regulator transcription factor [Ardenticatenaceae bacterium]